MIDALRKVIRRMHYPLEVMLICVRWHAAYPHRPISTEPPRTKIAGILSPAPLPSPSRIAPTFSRSRRRTLLLAFTGRR